MSLSDVEAARERIDGIAIRTPLVELEDAGRSRIFLKLENLQPIGAFKIRGSANAMAQANPELLERGVYTASAGNMAQGVAWNARRLGIPCTAIVPDHAPAAKLDAITRFGASIIRVSFEEWWQVIVTSEYPGLDGLFVHPVSDPAVIAGNGTIGLEIVEDLPDLDAVVVPYGGGGLISGIATVLREKAPGASIVAAEVATGAPLAAALQEGKPVEIPYEPSFVDGIGSTSVLESMWPLVRTLVDGSIVVSLDQIRDSLRILAERAKVVAEGAGAASLASALSGDIEGDKIVCIVSGGNIDSAKLAAILANTA